MTDKHAQPIDFVVLWVDDQDPEWQKSKRFHQGMAEDDTETTAGNRFRDWNLFHYMFRAFEEFTPWVNHIYLVTCGHVPKWLNIDHPKLTLVRHDEFMPKEYLPTFSSHPIELNLHRIKGLSEHFVYFNDDFFPLRPMSPEVFFKNGLPRDIFVQTLLTPCATDKVMSTIQFNVLGVTSKHFSKIEFLKKHVGKYLAPCYGKFFWRNLALLSIPKLTGFRSLHSAAPFKKSILEETWATDGETLHETCLRKFRDPRDVNQYVFAQRQVMKGEFLPISPATRPYCVIGQNRERYARYFEKQNVDIVCLNDVGNVDFEAEQQFLHQCFERILPKKSSFEV